MRVRTALPAFRHAHAALRPDEVRGTFPTFSSGKSHITATTLADSLAELGRPVDPLVSEEMIHEAERGDDPRGAGKVSFAEYCTMNSVTTPAS